MGWKHACLIQHECTMCIVPGIYTTIHIEKYEVPLGYLVPCNTRSMWYDPLVTSLVSSTSTWYHPQVYLCHRFWRLCCAVLCCAVLCCAVLCVSEFLRGYHLVATATLYVRTVQAVPATARLFQNTWSCFDMAATASSPACQSKRENTFQPNCSSIIITLLGSYESNSCLVLFRPCRWRIHLPVSLFLDKCMWRTCANEAKASGSSILTRWDITFTSGHICYLALCFLHFFLCLFKMSRNWRSSWCIRTPIEFFWRGLFSYLTYLRAAVGSCRPCCDHGLN